MDNGAAKQPGDGQGPAKYLNRELSWLEFNRRVLHEALDERTPLLERANFLSIFTSNLDEFFMKRVGGLKHQVAAGVRRRSKDGLTPAEQLREIRRAVLPMLTQQAQCFLAEVKPSLRGNGVHLLTWNELTADERRFADEFFCRELFPILTPLAVDSGHPFPLLSNLSLSLGVALRHPGREDRLFARVKVPEVLPQWCRLEPEEGDRSYRFISLIDIIRHNLDDLFPDMLVERVMPFRVTRNTDLERDEEDAEDLLDLIAEELRARRFARVVRLEHGADADPWILQFIMDELKLGEDDVYELAGELDYTDLAPITDLALPKLSVDPWTPVIPPQLADRDTDLFGLIRSSDLLVHHPYESFAASVERFIDAAADDPDVLAIKMTLYRTGDDSPFVQTMIRAAESGKQVVCLVELKARFDEQRNILWAQMLEHAGVHVVYGIVGLKTHTKTALVVRREPDGLRAYVHIGTGNYHTGTARLYTDLGLFTADPEFTRDVVELFHYLTGRSLKRQYRKLLVAPVNMRDRFLGLIENEIEHHAAGRPARIICKMNSLEDREIIEALYRASQAGVRIDLIVRGFCCLRPGVQGLSENIHVISVVGRFLEHSRIFFFRNGRADPADGECFIGSADWMSRNLDHRVEAITPIQDRALRERCCNLLELVLADQRQAWDMHADGSYTQRVPDDPAVQIGSQRVLMQEALQRARSIASAAATVAPDDAVDEAGHDAAARQPEPRPRSGVPGSQGGAGLAAPRRDPDPS